MTTARATTRHTKEVFTGLYIDYDDPQPEQISLEDIAHGLSHTCRYGGHSRIFYSVAEHAILCADLVLRRFPGEWRIALHALHHDDHEAYLGDLPTPLKNALGGLYDGLREQFDAAIGKKLWLDPRVFESEPVQRADAEALRLEAHLMLPSKGVGEDWAPAWTRFDLAKTPEVDNWSPGMEPMAAEAAFILAHYRLERAIARDEPAPTERVSP